MCIKTQGYIEGWQQMVDIPLEAMVTPFTMTD